MKIKNYLPFIAGTVLLVSSIPAMAQGQSREEKIRLLEEKRQEIERLEQDNDNLREQLSMHEASIADYRSQIEILEQQIQEQKEATGEPEDNS